MPVSIPKLIAAGASHPRVRQYLKIKQNRGPTGGALVLEGLWAISHASAAGVAVEVLFVCEALLRGAQGPALVRELADRGTLVLGVSDRVFRRLADREGPDGLAAIAHFAPPTVDDVSVTDRCRVVVADAFELAGNLGTLIRCADGAGAAAVLVTERRLRVAHPLVVKASMGTLFSLPVVDVSRPDAQAWLRRHCFAIVGGDPAAHVSYREAHYPDRVAIVLGNERHGLARFWTEGADQLVSIPMLGVADSLNVGHAAALLLYEALHQQEAGKDQRRQYMP